MADPSVGTSGTSDVIGVVIATLAEMQSRGPESISAEMRFFEDLSFDSTSVLELLMRLENELDVEFDPETLEPSDFETVRSLALYVEEQLPAPS
ncbi:acyl carrier protein [Sinosporangium album]|nr:acyl carrier protein [Sinosporangium album]